MGRRCFVETYYGAELSPSLRFIRRQNPANTLAPAFSNLELPKWENLIFWYCPTLPQMARALNQKDGSASQILCKSLAAVSWRWSWRGSAKTLEAGKSSDLGLGVVAGARSGRNSWLVDRDRKGVVLIRLIRTSGLERDDIKSIGICDTMRDLGCEVVT